MTLAGAIAPVPDRRETTSRGAARRPEGAADAGSRPAAVALSNVSKRFSSRTGTVQAVEDVSLSIAAGEFISILGPSGCGKSTLLNIIAGLMPVSGGVVEVLGKRVTGPVHDLGIVFQQHLLLPWRTVLKNVMLQIEVRHRRTTEYLPRARALLERVGLADFAERFPDELSGGMNQRASICRALIHDPDLLLMDEPFGALDAMTRDQMVLDFHQLSREEGKTVIFVTHSISEAVFLSNRVVVMSPRPGRVKAILSIDLGQERHLEVREEPEFVRYTREIRELFQAMGLFREGRRR
jgi:NitT/TauT family transport system ATP-binding protein